MSPNFTNEEDEKLIKLIQAHPAIYNLGEKDYKNLLIKKNIWVTVSHSLGKSVDDCKKRWKSIKDNFYKQKQKQKLATSSRPCRWALYEKLQFLNNIDLERSIKSNIPMAEEFLESEENEEVTSYDAERSSSPLASTSDSTTSQVVMSRKRKVSELADEFSNRSTILVDLSKKKEEEDDVDLFMKSLTVTMKKLPPHLIAQAKIKFLTILNDLQFPSNSSHPMYLPTPSSYSSSPVYSENPLVALQPVKQAFSPQNSVQDDAH